MRDLETSPKIKLCSHVVPRCSSCSTPTVPLRIGKSYAVPAIETDASAVRFLVTPFMGTRSATSAWSSYTIASVLPY